MYSINLNALMHLLSTEIEIQVVNEDIWISQKSLDGDTSSSMSVGASSLHWAELYALLFFKHQHWFSKSHKECVMDRVTVLLIQPCLTITSLANVTLCVCECVLVCVWYVSFLQSVQYAVFVYEDSLSMTCPSASMHTHLNNLQHLSFTDVPISIQVVHTEGPLQLLLQLATWRHA